MQVARVISPVSSRESWTVLGDDDAPVAPVDRYLAYLTDIERSPNTVKAYAHDLKDWFGFLAERGLDWRAVRLDDVGEFVAWLRLPLQARDGRVAVLPSVPHHCTESTVNRKLSAVGAFYTHAARDGVEVGELLTSWQVGGGRGGVEAVPASHQQERAEAAAGDRVEGAEEAAAGAVAGRGAGDPGRLRPAAGPVAVRRCCTTPGCGSVRHSGCGTTISPPPSVR